MSKQKQTRRKFLASGIILGGGISITLSQLMDADTSKSENLRLIDASGQVFEIERKHLQKLCAGKVSNKRLKKWMDNENKS